MLRFICLLAPDLRLDNPVSTVSTSRDIHKRGGRLALLCPGNNDDLVRVRGPVAQFPATHGEILSDCTTKAVTKGGEGATEMGLAIKKASLRSVRPSEHSYLILMGTVFVGVPLCCEHRQRPVCPRLI